MSRLGHEDYLAHIRSESALFRATLADCNPTASVPSCPGWDAGELLWHLTTVQRFWATMVRQRPDGPHDYADPARPGNAAELLGRFDQESAGLVAALESAAPTDGAWTWSDRPGDHSVAFVLRRQAHEALVHRLDAQLAAGTSSEVDARLAADGVAEALEVMYGGCPPWGRFDPDGRHVRVDCTDTGDQVWVALGAFSGTDPRGGATYVEEADVSVVPDPGTEPDAVVDGPAAALDAWLWHRAGEDDLAFAGDRATLTSFREVVSQPIN